MKIHIVTFAADLLPYALHCAAAPSVTVIEYLLTLPTDDDEPVQVLSTVDDDYCPVDHMLHLALRTTR